MRCRIVGTIAVVVCLWSKGLRLLGHVRLWDYVHVHGWSFDARVQWVAVPGWVVRIVNCPIHLVHGQ